MARKGFLIDFEFCTGCHSCELACQQEKGLTFPNRGIVVTEVGPWPIDEATDTWQYAYCPVPTNECDLCASRVAAGKKPSCVQHCQAAVMTYGEVAELAKALEDKPKQVLFVVE